VLLKGFLWGSVACVEEAPEVIALTAEAAAPGLDEPAAFTPAAAEGGPWACGAPLGTPIDGGFTQDVQPDPDTLLVGGADAPRRVHMVLGADSSREMTFVWQTDEATLGGRVQLGFAEDGLSWTLAGVSYPVGGARIHVARACGLAAERSWRDRVGSDAGWSDVGSFTTAAEAGVDTLTRFAVMGDSRSGPDTFAALFAASRAAGAEYVVFTGDAVSNGANWAEWEQWFDAGGDTFLHLPLVFAPGNHEANDVYFFALFPPPTGVGQQAIEAGPRALGHRERQQRGRKRRTGRSGVARGRPRRRDRALGDPRLAPPRRGRLLPARRRRHQPGHVPPRGGCRAERSPRRERPQPQLRTQLALSGRRGGGGRHRAPHLGRRGRAQSTRGPTPTPTRPCR
jgi:hypothetical protein